MPASSSAGSSIAILSARSGSLVAADRRRSLAAAPLVALPRRPGRGALGGVLPIGLRPVPSEQFGGFMLSLHHRRRRHRPLAAARHPAGARAAVGPVHHQEDLRGLHRGHPRRAADRLLLVASLLLNFFLPPGTNFDLMLRVIIMVTLFASAYMAEVDPRRARRAAARPVRGGRRAGPRLLEVDAAHHPAAGAQDLDPRDRQHLHRPLQGHHAGGVHRPARPDRPDHRDPRRLRTGTASTGSSTSSWR